MHSNAIPLRGTTTLPPAPAPDYTPPEEDHGGDWMISFVDILMLLLTLFVVLLAVSRSPKPAPKPTPVQTPVVAQAQPHPLPHVAKHTDTPPPRVQPVPVVSAPAQTPAPMAVATEEHRDAVIKPILPERAPAPPKPRPVAVSKVAPPAPTPKPVTTPVPKPAAPARPVLTVPEDLKNQVEITPTATAVNLVIKDDVLFDAGSAQLKPSGLALLKRVAGLFADNDYPISVEGYTDNIPIHTARFPSNWELSAARATNVTRFLIAQGVTADRLSAVGYADTRPRADNATAEGRAANRRVSLVVHVKEKADPPAGAHLAR